jgi:acyl-coenzyme A thioesterase PaaI-like protein
MNLPALLSAARTSALRRWVLNAALPWMIPFNRPHGFKVIPLPEGGISVRVPYRRINRNHIKGIHACALATAAEMCSGLSVLEHLDHKRYRLIMRSLHMAYHYQAKRDAVASCMPSAELIRATVLEPLAQAEAVDHVSTVQVHDTDGRHLATGTITWQVKGWGSVRTKV